MKFKEAGTHQILICLISLYYILAQFLSNKQQPPTSETGKQCCDNLDFWTVAPSISCQLYPIDPARKSCLHK